MFRKLATCFAVSAATALAAAPASADLSSIFGRASTQKHQPTAPELLPPAGYRGQWWVAPNRCEYSRSGRPGETVWFLIVNTARKGCATYLVEHGFKDAY